MKEMGDVLMYQQERQSNDHHKDLLRPRKLVELSFEMDTTRVLLASAWQQVIAPSCLLYYVYVKLG